MNGIRAQRGDFSLMLWTMVGRQKLLNGLNYPLWPWARRLASLYREVVLRDTKIVAVVGSMGKTTTTRAVSAVLGIPASRAVPGNSWSHIAWEMLAIEPWSSYGVLEVGIARRGDMPAYAALLRPDLCVVTSIGYAHHSSFGGPEGAAREKSPMAEAVPAGGTVVLNGDDTHAMAMASRTRAKVITYGFGEGNDIRASEIRLNWPRGMGILLHTQGHASWLDTRLWGRHMLYAPLAAMGVALSQGLPVAPAIAALEKLPPSPSRMELLPMENGSFILQDSFSCRQACMKAALSTLSSLPATRRTAVLGPVSEELGKRGPVYRGIGRQAALASSRLIFIGSRRCFRAVSVGATQNGMPREAVHHAGHSVLEAARILERDKLPGEVVLLKGPFQRRFERIPLLMAGTPVACDLHSCQVWHIDCAHCPRLLEGWKDGRRNIWLRRSDGQPDH